MIEVVELTKIDFYLSFLVLIKNKFQWQEAVPYTPTCF